jgi:predicted pyridoxine 5'-phosphate oxidase superfamily flavin-nucleotide-binding protein
MTSNFLNLVFTPAVKAAQESNGSRMAYARHDGATGLDRLTENEAAFIAARDSFYMATVSETGWPYLQHRGGPRGFVKVIGDRALGLADFRGNRQYVSVGNLSRDDRVALIFMDYPQKRRLKVLGRMRAVDLREAPELRAALVDEAYGARVERGLVVEVEAFDWNCPQHIVPRYSLEEITPVIDALKAQIAELKMRAAGPA